jgi:hypothetical protein
MNYSTVHIDLGYLTKDSFITEISNNIGDIIIKSKLFKSDATNLKETAALLDECSFKSLNELFNVFFSFYLVVNTKSNLDKITYLH